MDRLVESEPYADHLGNATMRPVWQISGKNFISFRGAHARAAWPFRQEYSIESMCGHSIEPTALRSPACRMRANLRLYCCQLRDPHTTWIPVDRLIWLKL